MSSNKDKLYDKAKWARILNARNGNKDDKESSEENRASKEHVGKYEDASIYNYLASDAAKQHHQAYSGQVNAGTAYNASKPIQSAMQGIYGRDAGIAINPYLKDIISSAQYGNDRAAIAAKQLEEGRNFLTEEGYAAYMGLVNDAYAYTDTHNQNMLRARTGDTSVLNEQKRLINELKLEGLDNRWYNKFLGVNHYNNQNEIDEAEGQYQEYVKLLRIAGMEDLPAMNLNADVADYDRNRYREDLMTVLRRHQGIEVDDAEYQAAVKNVRDFVGDAYMDIEQAAQDTSGQWMDGYLDVYDERMEALDKYIAKNSSAYGTEYAFDAGDYTQYMRALSADEQRKEQAAMKGKSLDEQAAELAAEAEQKGYTDQSEYVPSTANWRGVDYNDLALGVANYIPGQEEKAIDWDTYRDTVKYSFLNDYIAAAAEGNTQMLAEMDAMSGNIPEVVGYNLHALPYMSDEQRKTFYAYFNNGDYKAIDEFMGKINYDIAKRFMESWEEEYAQSLEGNVGAQIGGTIASFGSNLLANAAGLANTGNQLLQRMGILPDDGYSHEYNPSYMYQAQSDLARGTMGQTIEDATPWATIGGINIAKAAFQGISSVADSVAASAIGGPIGGLVLLSGGASGRELQEQMEAGNPNADIYAVGSGLIEAAFEKVGLDALFSGKVTKALFGNAAEEAGTELANMLWDVMINGDNNQTQKLLDQYRIMGYADKAEFATALVQAKQVLEAGISGAFGGTVSIPGAIASNVADKKQGAAVIENEGVGKLLDIAETVELPEDVKKLLGKVRTGFNALQDAANTAEPANIDVQAIADKVKSAFGDIEGSRAKVDAAIEKGVQAAKDALSEVGTDIEAAIEKGKEAIREAMAELPQAEAEADVKDVEDAVENSIRDALSEQQTTSEPGGKKNKSPKISNAAIGRIYRETMAKLDERAKAVLSENFSGEVAARLQGRGFKGNVQQMAQIVSDFIGGIKNTPEALQAIASSDIALELVNDLTAPLDAIRELEGFAQKKPKTEGIDKASEAAQETEDAELPEVEDEFDAVVAEVQGREILASEGETSTLDGEEIEILGVDTTEGAPKMKIRTASGEEKTVKPDAIAYSANDAGAYELAAYSEDYGRNGDLMYNAYQSGQNAAEYAKAFHKAVQYGSDGRNLDVLKKSGLVDVLTKDQLSKAYGLGRGMRVARGQEQQAALQAKSKGVETGKLDISQISMASLNKQQRASVTVMGKLAKALGFNVRFVESKADENGRYTTENGSYDTSTRTLTLDIHAGSNYASDTSYAVMHTAGHELTHYIKQFADSGLWNEYQDFVMGHLDSKMNLEAEIQKRMSGKQQLTRDAAIEEIIADASGEALSKLTAEQIQEMAEENPSLMKKIANFMKKWIGDLKRLVEVAFKDTTSKTEAAQQMQDALDEMAAKWNAMLVNAGKQANATKAQKQTSAAVPTNATKAQKKAPAPAPVQAKTDQQTEAGKQFIPYAHIDERSLDSVKDMHTELFCSQVEAAQIAYPKAASVLMDDLVQSIKGEKVFIWDNQGSLSVTGQKRLTSEMLAHMKDTFGWTWDDIANTLQNFIDMGDSTKGFPLVKNTIRNRRMEVYLHEMLTEGYTTIDGIKIAPWNDYAEMIAEYQGSQGAGLNARIAEDAIPFEEYISPDDVKYQERDDYSYKELISKPDMWVTYINTSENVTREDAVRRGRENVMAHATRFDSNGAPMLFVNDLGKNVVVGKRAMQHGLGRNAKMQNAIIANIGDILRNSIVVNEANPKKDGVKNTWILLGAAVDSEGSTVYVRSIVNQSTSEVEEVAALYAALGKKNKAGRVYATDAYANARGVPSGLTITIADLLSGVKDHFSDVISADVASNLGIERGASEFTDRLRYQERDPNQISDRELLATALQSVTQNLDEWDNLRRYQKKIAVLNEKQRLLEQTNARIAELTAQNSKANRDEIIRLKNAANVYTKQINRADGELLKYEAMKPIKKLADREREAYKQELKAKTDEQIRRYKERLKMDTEDKIREVREREAEKRRKLREQGDDRLRKAVQEAVQEQREVGQRKVDRLKESQDREKYRAMILKKAKRLHDWVSHPTNKGHVPDFLRKPLADFLESIDFSSKHVLEGGDQMVSDRKFADALEALRYAVSDIQKQQTDIDSSAKQFRGYIDLPANFVQRFDELVRKIKITLEAGKQINDTPFNRMTAAQLQEMNNFFKLLNHSILKMNELTENGRYNSAKNASSDTVEDMNAMAAKVKVNKVLAGLNSIFNWKNTTPYYAFQRLGRGGKAIFEGLQNGWDKMAQNSAELISYAEDAFTAKQAKAWSKDIKTIKLDSGESVQITAAQAMSLYCLNKRAQAIGHLMGGGIRISDIDAGRGNTISQVDNYILSAEDVNRITGTMSAEQRTVADKLQRFMNTTCTDWGNEISMKRFGYKMFTESNYFPIETDANNRSRIDDKHDGNNSMFRLLNMSAMKPLTEKANNAIIIRDIFDVFSNHASDIAKYNALALPILDFIKWYNHVEKSEVKDKDGKPTGQFTTRSTQKALERAYGSDAREYLMNFIKDLNAEHDGGRNDSILTKMMGNAKAGSVSANIRVAFLQITSLPRAAYAIDPKYLAGGMMKLRSLNPASAIRGTEAQEKIGILKWKKLGFYSTDVARSTRGMVRRDDSVITKVRDIIMKPAEWGDNWVSNIIYEAVKLEMKTKHPGVKEGTNVYNTLVNNRVREIVYKTQVVDSTMTRSDFMRSKGLMTTFTAFMSEPTLTVNMLNEAIQEAVANHRTGMKAGENWKAVGGKVVSAAATFAFTAFASSLVESLFDAIRDDDDYEEFEEKFFEAMKNNLTENVNPLTMLPFIKDLWSFVSSSKIRSLLPFFKDEAGGASGYENSSMITQGVEGVVDVINAIDGYQKGTRPIYNVIYNALKAIGYNTGVGVQNATRDGVGLYNTFLADAWGTPKIQTYENTKAEGATAYYNAVMSGDTEKADWILHRAEINGLTKESFADKIVTLVQDDYLAGKLDADSAIDALVEHAGKKKEQAAETVGKWQYGAATGMKYSNLKQDYLDGKISEADVRRYSAEVEGLNEEKIEDRISSYNYTKSTGKTTTAPKYWELAYTHDSGGDYKAYADKLLDEIMATGRSYKQARASIASSLESYYKKDYLEIKGTPEGDRMLEEILDVYEAIGFPRSYERDYINKNWEEDE